MAQRVSTRGPAPLRTSSSDSDPLHHRPITDRSPKLGDRRSPRSAHSEPLNQKKLGTRIAGLETQLEQAQGELKILKDQLASAEAAKKEAQKELEKRSKKPAVSEPEPVQDTRSSPSENQDSNNEENPDDNQKETDVFEVPIEMMSLEPKVEVPQSQICDQDEVKVSILPESPEKPRFEDEIAVKNEEISLLKVKIEEKDKTLEAFVQENEGLKRQLSEANVQISSAMVKEEKMNQNLTQVEQELKRSKNDGIQLKEKLKEVEGAKEALEAEMKKLRVQTEQWRKAADAAAAILAGGVDMSDGRRVSERCGSMDKQQQQHYGGVFDGYGGFVGSPGLGDECDEGFNGKRKGSGIKMFGDLWKKKGGHK